MLHDIHTPHSTQGDTLMKMTIQVSPVSEVLLPAKQLPSLSSSTLLSKRSEEYGNTTQYDTDRTLAIGKTR